MVANNELSILVAEDDHVSRKLISILLERRMGFAPTMVENGEAAYQLLKTQSFDIVLLDYHMPICNGPKTAAQIRSDSNITTQPIIVGLSATAGDERVEFEQSGIDYFLSKPIKPSDIANLIAQIEPPEPLKASA